MTKTTQPADNIYLSGSLSVIFAKTAAPIILIMLVNGLFTLVDAYFLGEFVGADALTAVTMMFPLYMLIVALSTLVSSGFSSVLARQLGARRLVHEDANEAETTASLTHAAGVTYSQALVLAALVCAVLVGLFLTVGPNVALMLAKGSHHLADLGLIYIGILVICSPMVFALAISVDTLRCEGKLPFMAAVSLSSALLNIIFNYVLIAIFEWGVAGSAYGTVLAQLVSLSAIILYRRSTRSAFDLARVRVRATTQYWREFLSLGAPQSLGYIGLSLSAAATIYALQIWNTENYNATVAAYGIITRLMTFIFLPLLGLSMAFQTICGNNFGAQLWHRTNGALRLALWMAFVYCAVMQALMLGFRHDLGAVFVSDPDIHAELARILPYMMLLLFLFGPLFMIGTYFQAIGDAPRAAIFTLTRTYGFSLPLIFILPFALAEPGIWISGPMAEMLMLGLTVVVLFKRSRHHRGRFGLFCAVD